MLIRAADMLEVHSFLRVASTCLREYIADLEDPELQRDMFFVVVCLSEVCFVLNIGARKIIGFAKSESVHTLSFSIVELWPGQNIRNVCLH